MFDYKITCCSTADMPASYFAEKKIPFAKFHFHMDGKEYLDDLGESIAFEEFYNRIAAGAMPTTSQVNAQEFMELFEPILEQGKDILHISLSSGISGVINSAKIAQAHLKEKYPERKILIVDSLAASSGYGMLVDKAWELRSAGYALEETYHWLEENKLNLHHWFFSTDLQHYKRGGRISATAAMVGTLLYICPLMNMNNKGELIPRVKVRGKKKVIREIARKMKQHAQGGVEYSGKCFISHSACLQDAQMLAEIINTTFPNLDGKVLINSVGTVIGSHTGPGTVALFFWGDRRGE